MKTKKELRKEILGLRKELSGGQVAEMSDAICSRIENMDIYGAAKDLCLYMPINNEVDVTVMAGSARKDGKTVWIPKVTDGDMVFMAYEEDTPLARGAFGIQEPQQDADEGSVLIPDKRTLVIMPGAVFSEERDRIGYGGGYYDRFLDAYPEVMTAAVCYDFQILPRIPSDDHDIRPMAVVSEKRVLK